jgi:hypothetical protein
MSIIKELERWEISKDPHRAKHVNKFALKIYSMDNRKRGEFFEFYTIEQMKGIKQIETVCKYCGSKYFKMTNNNAQPDIAFTTTENPEKPILAEVKSVREKTTGSYEITRLSIDGYKYLIIHMICPRGGLFTFSMKESDIFNYNVKYVEAWDKWSFKIPSVKWMQQQKNIIYENYDCIIENEGLNNFADSERILPFINKLYA